MAGEHRVRDRAYIEWVGTLTGSEVALKGAWDAAWDACLKANGTVDLAPIFADGSYGQAVDDLEVYGVEMAERGDYSKGRTILTAVDALKKGAVTASGHDPRYPAGVETDPHAGHACTVECIIE
jgi:hypothetical protein